MWIWDRRTLMHSGARETNWGSPSGCRPTFEAQPSTSVKTIRFPCGSSFLRTKFKQVIFCQCSRANSIILCSLGARNNFYAQINTITPNAWIQRLISSLCDPSKLNSIGCRESHRRNVGPINFLFLLLSDACNIFSYIASAWSPNRTMSPEIRRNSFLVQYWNCKDCMCLYVPSKCFPDSSGLCLGGDTSSTKRPVSDLAFSDIFDGGLWPREHRKIPYSVQLVNRSARNRKCIEHKSLDNVSCMVIMITLDFIMLTISVFEVCFVFLENHTYSYVYWRCVHNTSLCLDWTDCISCTYTRFNQ